MPSGHLKTTVGVDLDLCQVAEAAAAGAAQLGHSLHDHALQPAISTAGRPCSPICGSALLAYLWVGPARLTVPFSQPISTAGQPSLPAEARPSLPTCAPKALELLTSISILGS